jgi:hypothetical protein
MSNYRHVPRLRRQEETSVSLCGAVEPLRTTIRKEQERSSI